MQPRPTSAHRKPTVYIPPELADATHVFIRRGGVQPSFATPYEGPFRVVERLDTGYRVLMPGGRQEVVALARLKPAHVDADDVLEDPEQHLDDARPPSPPPPGRRPGPRTRMPQPTDRVTRQSRNAPSSSGSNPAASADAQATANQSSRRSRRFGQGSDAAPSSDDAPSTRAHPDVSGRQPSSLDSARPTTRIRRTTRSIVPPSAMIPSSSALGNDHDVAGTSSRTRQQVRNLADFNTRTSVSPSEPVNRPALEVIPEESSDEQQRTTEQPSRSDAYVSEQLYATEDDPSSQPSLFELGRVTLPDPHLQTVPVPMSSQGLAPPPGDPTPTSGQQSTSSLGPARFSSRRDDQPGRRYFSDTRPGSSTTRYRPDVSVIFEHLGMNPSSVASSPQNSSSAISAGGRVAS